MQSLAPDVRDHPTPVMFVDNKSAIHAATNAQDNEKQRHIYLRAHCIRDSVTPKDIELKFIPGTENPAGAQTKPCTAIATVISLVSSRITAPLIAMVLHD